MKRVLSHSKKPFHAHLRTLVHCRVAFGKNTELDFLGELYCCISKHQPSASWPEPVGKSEEGLLLLWKWASSMLQGLQAPSSFTLVRVCVCVC